MTGEIKLDKPTLLAAREELFKFYMGTWDDQIDSDEMIDEDFALIDTAIADTISKMCKILGHRWEDDHCGIPAHKFCWYCHTPITARALADLTED